MALHNGIDTVSIIAVGVYSKTYGSGDGTNIANLFASFGLLEDAPTKSVTANWIRKGLKLMLRLHI